MYNYRCKSEESCEVVHYIRNLGKRTQKNMYLCNRLCTKGNIPVYYLGAERYTQITHVKRAFSSSMGQLQTYTQQVNCKYINLQLHVVHSKILYQPSDTFMHINILKMILIVT